MSFPHEDQETLYRKSLNDVAKMLKSKHGENYMVSSKRSCIYFKQIFQRKIRVYLIWEIYSIGLMYIIVDCESVGKTPRYKQAQSSGLRIFLTKIICHPKGFYFIHKFFLRYFSGQKWNPGSANAMTGLETLRYSSDI